MGQNSFLNIIKGQEVQTINNSKNIESKKVERALIYHFSERAKLERNCIDKYNNRGRSFAFIWKMNLFTHDTYTKIAKHQSHLVQSLIVCFTKMMTLKRTTNTFKRSIP